MTRQADAQEIEVVAEQKEIDLMTGDAEKKLMKAEPALVAAA